MWLSVGGFKFVWALRGLTSGWIRPLLITPDGHILVLSFQSCKISAWDDLLWCKDCATFLTGNQTAEVHLALQVSLLLVWFRFTYEIAPVFVLMEQLTLKKMREIVGWPDGEGDGIFSPGKISTNDQPPIEAHVHENSKSAIIKLYSWCKVSHFTDKETDIGIIKLQMCKKKVRLVLTASYTAGYFTYINAS